MIIKIKIYLILVLLASCLVCSDSDSNIDSLELFAAAGISPELNWYKAAKLGSEEAKSLLHQHAVDTNQPHWLNLLSQINFQSSQYQLALLQTNLADKKRLLRASAEQNYPPALFQLGVLSDDATQKKLYLTRAAEQEYLPAKKALYQWLWLEEKYEEALPWLTEVAKGNADDSLKLGLYQWRNGKYEAAMEWLKQAESRGSSMAQSYNTLIDKYWRKPAMGASLPLSREFECEMTLQLVATSLDTLLQANDFKQNFESDKRLAKLPICINPLYWAEDDVMACDSHATNGYRVTCDLSKLDDSMNPEYFSHLVIFADKGKANVRNGVMYLDLADTYSVFVHELAHFVGFVDEYPLSSEFANYFCNSVQDYPNLALLTPEQDITALDPSYWESRGGAISIVKARTCNNHENQAFKFSKELTFMEFHDTNYIPELYLNIWQEIIRDRHRVRPAYINIAQSLEEQGNSPAARRWWDAYDLWTQGENTADLSETTLLSK